MDKKKVQAEEPIARFIFQKRHYSKKNNRVKHGAFLPPATDNEKSVYRIIELTENAVWAMGDKFVAQHTGKDIRARADLGVNQVVKIGLDVVPEVKTHPRHANIKGWPDSRDERRQLAVDLAESSSLIMKPDPGS